MKERDEYILKRNLKYEKQPKKQFPIYRKIVTAPTKSDSTTNGATNNKYAHIKPKVKTFFPKKTQVY